MPVKSPLPDLDLIDVPLHKFVLDGLKQHPDYVALIDGETDERWSGLEVLQQSQLIAAALQHRLAICKNDVVMFFLPNCPRHAICILGTLTVGAVVSGCNPVYNAEELHNQMCDADPVMIITDANGIGVVREAIANTKRQNVHIVILDQTEGLQANEYSYADLLESQCGDVIVPDMDTRSDVCLMPYSSGTTGTPKGTLLTHYNKVAMLQTLNNRDHLRCPVPGDTSIAVLPFFHLFGLMVLLPALRDGVTMVTIRKFRPEPFLKHIQDHKVHMIYLVPPIIVLLAKHPVVSKYDISSLETILVGAAPIGEQLSKDLCAKHPNIKYLIQGYGMTEVSGAATIMPPTLDQARFGSCGVLVSNTEAMIVDIDRGKELGANEPGELWLRGPGNMKGYLRKQAETAATVDEQGWVHTGDIAQYDEDGYFYIVDRLKSLIKVKGFQVAPAELEDHLIKVNDVADAAVIGKRDEQCGELPVAFVVRKLGSTITAEEIMKAVNGHVAPYKKLSAVYFVDEVPKSPAGKILHRLLRDKFNKGMTIC